MKLLHTALAGLLALLTATAAVAQQFPTIPSQSVIGRLGVAGSSGPSQAIPLATLLTQLGGGTTNAIFNTNSIGTGALRNILTGQNYSSAMTNTGEAYGYSFRNSTTTGNAVYNAIFPGVSVQDGIQSVLDIPTTATVTQGSAISAYVKNDVGAGGGGKNAVGLFSAAIGTVNNSAVWGINTLLMDAATRTVGTGTGRILKNELDFNVMNPGTLVTGMSVTGNSLAQPTTAVGYEVASLGTGIVWPIGYSTVDGAATYAANFGSQGTAANSNGQFVGLNWRDAGAVARSITMQATGGFLAVAGSGAFGGVKVTAGSFYTDQTFGLTINGKSAITSDVSNNTIVGNSTTGTIINGTSFTFGSKVFALGGSLTTTGANTTTLAFGATGRTYTFPDISSTVALLGSAQTFSATQTFADGGTWGSAGINTSQNIVTSNNIVGPTLAGAGLASSTLTLESTYGAGTSDAIIFKTGSQVEAARILTSQVFKFGVASFTANGAVATAMTSLGPAGSHTTVQKWFTVQDSGGTVLYIPAF